MLTRPGPNPAADLGPSWLASVPDGACVLARDIQELRVAAVATTYFSAGEPGRRSRRCMDVALVPVADRVLLRSGARLWLVSERVVSVGGAPQWVTGVRVQRPGVTAEQAFRGANGGGS